MIDTHAHIDDPQYAEHFDEFIAAQKAGGVTRILVPATTANSCKDVVEVCRRTGSYALPAFGIHPEEIREDWQQQIAGMKTYYHEICTQQSAISNCQLPLSLVAIGEIGLDYHFSTEFKTEQQQAFRAQLDWALELSLPVMIHSRDATEDCLTILEEYAKQGITGVMHCFSGSRETAQRVLDMGFYLGIGGVITFKNSRLADTLTGAGRFPQVPLERIVLETDCPYMAPVPYRGQVNEPRFIRHVIERLSAAYGVAESDIERLTDENATRLFHLTD